VAFAYVLLKKNLAAFFGHFL